MDGRGRDLNSINALFDATNHKRQIAAERFIDRARAVHGDRYDYSRAIYTRSQDPVEIICPTHGAFFQSAANHLQGKGCIECRSDKARARNEVSRRDAAGAFVAKARAVHGDKYDYSLVDYETARKCVRIICPAHGEFTQTPDNHLRGKGCAGCKYELTTIPWDHSSAPSGLADSPAILYLFRFEGEGELFFKIGVTTDLGNRMQQFNGLPYRAILAAAEYGKFTQMLRKEAELKSGNRDKRYRPKKRFAGHTECYDISILNCFHNTDSVPRETSDPTAKADSSRWLEDLLQNIPKRLARRSKKLKL